MGYIFEQLHVHVHVRRVLIKAMLLLIQLGPQKVLVLEGGRLCWVNLSESKKTAHNNEVPVISGCP